MTVISTIQGDTWDKLAKRVYGNEKLMHVLIAANPEYKMTAIFMGGVSVTVPDVKDTAVSVPPPWRQS